MRVAPLAIGLILLTAGPAFAEGLTVRMSGDILIPAGTQQDGAVMTMNGRVQVDGTLTGDAMTMNGDITISGTVAGSVRPLNGNVLLISTARVDGDVWAINGRVDRQPGAQVGGQIGEGLVFMRPRARQAPGLRRPFAGMGAVDVLGVFPRAGRVDDDWVHLAVLGLVPSLGWLAAAVAMTWGIGGTLLVIFRRDYKAPAGPPLSTS